MPFQNPARVEVSLPDGPVASQEWVQDQLAERGKTVKDYGAVGDGVADDTAAIQAALDAGYAFLPRGNYLVSALKYTAHRTVLEGVGDDSVLVCDGTTLPAGKLLTRGTIGLGRCVLRNLKLLQWNPGGTAAGNGLDTSDMPNFIAENVRIENFNFGHTLIDVGSTTFYSHFSNLQIFDCVNGILVSGSQANQNTWYNPRVRPKSGGSGTGIRLSDTRGATFIGADVECGAAGGAGITGIYIEGSSRENWFINPWVEANETGVVVDAGARRNGFIGGSITSNLTADIVNNAGPVETTFLNTSRTGQTVWSLGHALRGAGSPEGVVVAPVGTLYLRSDGGAGTTMYVKESGTAATGWVAK